MNRGIVLLFLMSAVDEVESGQVHAPAALPPHMSDICHKKLKYLFEDYTHSITDTSHTEEAPGRLMM
jgi:hypothetical protein